MTFIFPEKSSRSGEVGSIHVDNQDKKVLKQSEDLVVSDKSSVKRSKNKQVEVTLTGKLTATVMAGQLVQYNGRQ